MSAELILASASPRRADLLQSFGLDFSIEPADIDEAPKPNELGPDLIRRVALEKAQKVAKAHPLAYVLGADTGVLLDQQCLGKPRDDQEAIQMLTSLSGRSHQVCSAVALIEPSGLAHEAFVTTTVWFSSLPEAFIKEYVASKDPLDKAGGYAIQNQAGIFVSRIEGSYTNVVGLPLFETGQLLRQASLWHPQGLDPQRDRSIE